MVKGETISKRVFFAVKIIAVVLVMCLVMPGLTLAKPTKSSQNKVKPVAIDSRLKLKQKKMAELKAKQSKLAKELSKITTDYQEAYNKLIIVSDKVQASKKSLDQASMDLAVQQNVLNKRVSSIYKNREETLLLDLLLNIKTFEQLVSDFKFLKVVSDKDAMLVKKTKELKDDVENRYSELNKIKEKKTEIFKKLQSRKDAMQRNLENQNIIGMLLQSDIIRLQKVSYQLGRLKIAIVFPVAGPHSYIDDWGFPRSGGRTHKGTDIFAAKGTPLVAATDGFIGKYSPKEKGLGGITETVYGYDGNHYYYAHLSKLAKGIKVGTKVKAGQVIGYVGNTGNARTTPPHLHFQLHPGGGDPIDPYPFLRASDPNLW